MEACSSFLSWCLSFFLIIRRAPLWTSLTVVCLVSTNARALAYLMIKQMEEVWLQTIPTKHIMWSPLLLCQTAGHIARCKMFLDSVFSCGDLPDVDAHEVYLLRKCWSVGPFSWPLPTWTCLDLLTPNPGIWNPEINPGTPVYHSSSLTLMLMTASEHYLIRTPEVANMFIPLEFDKENDLRFHWQWASMSSIMECVAGFSW